MVIFKYFLRNDILLYFSTNAHIKLIVKYFISITGIWPHVQIFLNLSYAGCNSLCKTTLTSIYRLEVKYAKFINWKTKVIVW